MPVFDEEKGEPVGMIDIADIVVLMTTMSITKGLLDVLVKTPVSREAFTDRELVVLSEETVEGLTGKFLRFSVSGAAQSA